MQRLTSMVLGCWLLAATAAAQPGPGEKWVALASGPFTMFSNARPESSADLLLALEQLRAVVSHLSPAPLADERPTVLYAFVGSESMAPYVFTQARQDVVQVVEFMVAPEATYIVLNAAEPAAEVLPWVYRAYLDQDLLRRHPQLPRWARSGLAHFYATLEGGNGDSVRIGRPDKHLLDTLQSADWHPLEELFAATPDSAILGAGRSRQVHEAQAWLLTHYLMTGGGSGAPRATELYAALQGGASAEATVQQVLGIDFTQLESALVAHARGAARRDFELAVEDLPQRRAQPAPVPQDAMALRLGQYLARAHEPPPVAEARRHLEPLLAAADLAGDALASLAELSRRTGDRNEAAVLYARAMAAEPREAMSLLGYARFLAETGGAVEERRQALERAIAIDPDLGDAWAALAETHPEDPAAFARHAERALALMPERSDLAYNLAVAHLRAGDPASARRVAAERLTNPDDRALAARAEEEILRLERVSSANDALQGGDVELALEHMRRALAEATDAAIRAQIETELGQLEQRARRSAQIAAFNEAVALVNSGQLAAARERLLRLLPEVEDPALLTAVEDLLGRLAEDR